MIRDRVPGRVVPNETKDGDPFDVGIPVRPSRIDGATQGSDLSGWNDDAIEETLEFTLRPAN